MRSNLAEAFTDLLEDSGAVLTVHFNDLTDEDDRLETGESRFALEAQEILNQG